MQCNDDDETSLDGRFITNVEIVWQSPLRSSSRRGRCSVRRMTGLQRRKGLGCHSGCTCGRRRGGAEEHKVAWCFHKRKGWRRWQHEEGGSGNVRHFFWFLVFVPRATFSISHPRLCLLLMGRAKFLQGYKLGFDRNSIALGRLSSQVLETQKLGSILGLNNEPCLRLQE